MSFVDVLPLAPVTATTFASMRDRSSRASIISASPGRTHGHRRTVDVEAVAHQHPRGAVRERLRHEPPAVGPFAGQRDEQRARARRRGSRSRRTTPRRPSPRNSPSTARATSVIRRGFTRGSPGPRAPREPRRGRRTGRPRPGTPGSARGPCPATTTTSPASASCSASRIAARRSGSITNAPPPSFAPGSISAMIASGSSDRGLSVVTTLRSAFAVAAAPIGERFARSRSPPQPNTTDQATGRQRARRAQHASDAIRRVCVVHHHQEILTGLDRLHPAGNLPERRETPPDRVVVDAERARGGGGAPAGSPR